MRLYYLSCLLLVLGCNEAERPGAFVSSDKSDGGSSAGPSGGIGAGIGGPKDDDCEGAPTADTETLCGNQVVPVVQAKPNLYFVVDVSGSMNDPITGSTKSKISATKQALTTVAKEIGHRVNYGLAAFPGEDGSDDDVLRGCFAGTELFETREGDPLECLNKKGGEVLDDFTQVVLSLGAVGGTPLAATIRGISPTVLTLKGTTSILLMTDGGPNCNSDANCDADQCIPNIEGGAVPSGACDAQFNCCDSAVVASQDLAYLGVPEAQCVDADPSVEAVQELFDAGITTYVIGVPGSETYADTMNRLAIAGGTARTGDVAYYDVRDTESLNTALLAIGSEVAQTCTLTLDKPPSDLNLLNVYLDAELLERGSDDGWSIEDDTVTLHGAACDKVQAGDVNQIQMVSGCPSVVVR